MKSRFLPISADEMKELGWDSPDFVYVIGEAYVDHPSFGHAIISRILESKGYRVAMLCLPDWKNASAFMMFGRPKLGFLVSAGVIDSMVNHYTAAKKIRNSDAYAPGGKAGMRPDRATIVYCNKIREAFGNIPILIGGVEASLRRFSHYDYWSDKIRHSILVDSGADILMYGMGEKSIVECAEWIQCGCPEERLPSIRGICYLQKNEDPTAIRVPSHNEICSSKKAYADAFMIQYNEQDPIRGKRLCQQQDTQRYLIQNQPSLPLTENEMDAVYELPYCRNYHPSYEQAGGVPALKEVEFSIASTRGCFGSCSFCAITFHQGRIIQSRSVDSIVREGRLLTQAKHFKGYIHDVGGPTANFLAPSCEKQLKNGTCKNRQCLYPSPCKNLKISHKKLLSVLRQLRALPGVKKVFIRSGLRYDYIVYDKDPEFLNELCRNHISGQLKVAPEHVCPYVLDRMGKPHRHVYDEFVRKYEKINQSLGLKQYLIPYLMSSHPGCDLNASVELACYLNETGFYPDQVQDFYPTPGTLSTCMYYTGTDPRTGEEVYVARSYEEKRMQRALMQFREPGNAPIVRKALKKAGREDLIGYGKACLVRPGENHNRDEYPRIKEKHTDRPRGQTADRRKQNQRNGKGKQSTRK